MAKEKVSSGRSWIWKDEGARERHLVVFVHGYTGHPEATWQKFPDLLIETPEFKQKFEVISFGYETGLLVNLRGVKEIAGELLTCIDAQAREARNIYFVAHSLGGIVVRHFLADTYEDERLRKYFYPVRQVFCIGTPHYGAGKTLGFLLKLAGWLPWLVRRFNRLAWELRPDSPMMQETLDRWGGIAGKLAEQGDKKLPKVKNFVGEKDNLAPYERVMGGKNSWEEVRRCDAGHIELAKPHDEENEVYRIVKQDILKCAREWEESEARAAEIEQAARGILGPGMYQLLAVPGDFVGREKQLKELREKASRRAPGAAVLIGITGMGGAGKTALGLRLAHELKKDYPDAQIYLDLRGVDPGRKGEKPLEPADVMRYVIGSFHPEEKAPEEANKLEARYRSVLAKKRALLFYDNAQDAEQVRPLLPPEGCLLLVTSRQEIYLNGLAAVRLKPLEREESCRLLLAIEPRIDGFAGEIAELCGDLPQALRSAGCTLKQEHSLSVKEYAGRLRDERERLQHLRPGGHPELDVEASLEVSYELLDREQQRLFRGLAVFAGPFRGEAAAAVWDTGLGEARRQLEELRRWNLVEFSEESEHFRLHDLVKVFAGEKIQEDERLRFGRRHAEHFCKVLAYAQALFMKGGEGVRQGLRLFDAERENIEAGWGWAAENRGSSREALELCSRYPDAGPYILSLRMHSRRLIEWLRLGLEAAEKLGDKEAKGNHLGNLGNAYLSLGEVGHAIGFYEQHLAIAREIGDRQGEGATLGNLGLAYAGLGEVRKAIEYHTRALEISREIGDRRGEGQDLGNLGNAYARLGEVRMAIELYEESLKIAREIGDRRGEGNALGNLGTAYSSLGEFRKAIGFYQERLAIAREIGDRQGEGAALGNLGNAYARLGEVRMAIGFYQERLAIAREIGDRQGEGTALGNLGLAYAALGEVRRAIELYEESLKIAREIGDRHGEGNALGNLGNAYFSLGEVRKAIGFYEQHLAIAQEIGDRQGEGAALGNLGNAYAALGEVWKAIGFYEESLKIAQKIGDRRGEGTALGNLGLAYARLGEKERAIEYTKEALKIFEEIESPEADKMRRRVEDWGVN